MGYSRLDSPRPLQDLDAASGSGSSRVRDHSMEDSHCIFAHCGSRASQFARGYADATTHVVYDIASWPFLHTVLVRSHKSK